VRHRPPRAASSFSAVVVDAAMADKGPATPATVGRSDDGAVRGNDGGDIVHRGLEEAAQQPCVPGLPLSADFLRGEL